VLCGLRRNAGHNSPPKTPKGLRTRQPPDGPTVGRRTDANCSTPLSRASLRNRSDSLENPNGCAMREPHPFEINGTFTAVRHQLHYREHRRKSVFHALRSFVGTRYLAVCRCLWPLTRQSSSAQLPMALSLRTECKPFVFRHRLGCRSTDNRSSNG